MGQPADEFGRYTAGRCWLDEGSWKKAGYPRISFEGKEMGHRQAYEVFYGSVPKGMVVDHLCREIRCVRPSHCQVVSRKENLNRGKPPGKKLAEKRQAPTKQKLHDSSDRCKWGHLKTSENGRINSRGHWVCRICENRRKKEHRLREREKNPPRVRRQPSEAKAKKIRIVCGKGHLMSDDNLIIRANGDRLCRACHLERQRKYHEKKSRMS